MPSQSPTSNKSPNLLLVEDDEMFLKVMGRALEKRGFNVYVAQSANEGIDVSKNTSFEYAVIDLNMPESSGLTLLQYLMKVNPETKAIILTGYASIATAVEAIKLGAVDYLPKPADADDVIAAFHRKDGNPNISIPTKPFSIDHAEREYVQKVLNGHNGNISATARALGMHRRTLQRKLQKHSQLF